MQRKPGYPVANCNIKMPDSIPISEAVPCDDEGDQQQRRQQLINFGHTQWGFNNWSWSCAVTNALRETLLSFGGNIATELLELLESHRARAGAAARAAAGEQSEPRQ
ncbi:hypothetical protein MSG28_008417 [Choristoneura fumiferana]|uniref:Uncharacterized protein n=1 Tax=Choristoneura fumiferana TaxID=7141 RepID=A0ACC0J5K3_CHOFU|nr:hypothetical protein MSG28_008417 [Choristoneura fumiferana]